MSTAVWDVLPSLGMVDPYAPTALFVQVADAIAARIKAGKLKRLNPIPSELAITQEFGVSRGTARAAVAELRRRGLVFTVPHRGTYVGPPPD